MKSKISRKWYSQDFIPLPPCSMSDFISSTPTVIPTNCHLHTELASAKNCVLSSFAIRRTNSRTYQHLVHFWYHSVPFITRHVCELFLKNLSKATNINRHCCFFALYEPHPLRILIITGIKSNYKIERKKLGWQ